MGKIVKTKKESTKMDVIRSILTAFLSVTALFIITKLMGHKQIAQLDFFDYISGITIGSIAAELATELEEPWKPLIALGIYGLSSIFLNLLTHKLPKSRKYINGTPTILMNEGKIFRKNLKQAKLDLSEFLMLCRERGYFNVDEIQCAIFEHNGKLSVLPKAANRPATPTDLKITAKATHIGCELIMDGRIMSENLERIGRDLNWLKLKLKTEGCEDLKSVFLAVYHADGDRISVYCDEAVRESD